MKNTNLEKYTKWFRISGIIAAIAAIAFAFSTIYPTGEEIFSQHMGDDGPGVIEYYIQYTPFEEFLMDIAPILLCVLAVFLILTVVFFVKMRKIKKGKD